MSAKHLTSLIFMAISAFSVCAQTYFVDASSGNDANNGSSEQPFQSLEKAVAVANNLTGTGSIAIKLSPGLYTLKDKVVINPVRILNDTMRFSIEARVLPGDPLWSATELPIVQSVSPNNSSTQFQHSTGLLVACSHVSIWGLKFLGNANPSVLYYYPITRENPSLVGLEVRQCYFVGNKNGAVIQGGVWAQGQRLGIHHCIFYGCRNAILAFSNIAGCSITHNIIYGAYESALWVGENHSDFQFSNNIISHCHFVWVNSHSGPQTYQLSNSLIVENEHFLGKWNNDIYDVVEYGKSSFLEKNIVRNGKIELIERLKPEEKKPWLHLTADSSGQQLDAGIITD